MFPKSRNVFDMRSILSLAGGCRSKSLDLVNPNIPSATRRIPMLGLGPIIGIWLNRNILSEFQQSEFIKIWLNLRISPIATFQTHPNRSQCWDREIWPNRIEFRNRELQSHQMGRFQYFEKHFWANSSTPNLSKSG